jgi:hypothetical protein
MSKPVDSHVFHSTKHVMYTKDPSGEWVRYMGAKNLQQLLDLYRKQRDANVIPRVVRIQQIRTVTKVITEQHITLDLLNEKQIEAVLFDDKERRARNDRDRRQKKKEGSLQES